MNKGLLVVFSGPSGVGKGSVRAKLDMEALNMKVSTSMTTRAPRPEDKEGVTYYFVTPDQFDEAVEHGEFLEYAKFVSASYGTPKKPVEKMREDGINVMLEIETKGAAQVMEKCPDCLSIFLAPPSFEELERRIVGRGTEKPEEIKKRLAEAEEEMKLADRYDYVVVNDDLDEAARKITEIIEEASCQSKTGD